MRKTNSNTLLLEIKTVLKRRDHKILLISKPVKKINNLI